MWDILLLFSVSPDDSIQHTVSALRPLETLSHLPTRTSPGTPQRDLYVRLQTVRTDQCTPPPRVCDRDRFFRSWWKSRPTERTGRTGLRGLIFSVLRRVYGKLLYFESRPDCASHSSTTPRRTERTEQTGRSQSKSRDRPTEHFFNFSCNPYPRLSLTIYKRSGSRSLDSFQEVANN
jgi:hypothetical protein